jgi:hypothetical protein
MIILSLNIRYGMLTGMVCVCVCFAFRIDLNFSEEMIFNENVLGVPNFNDGLYRFGGWTHPAIKQYNDHGPCFDVDVNWYVISPKDTILNISLFWDLSTGILMAGMKNNFRL